MPGMKGRGELSGCPGLLEFSSLGQVPFYRDILRRKKGK
jgi:hypothetical protein